MPRWEPDGVERLQTAAFELFAQQGFELTTVAEIASRARLTQRTFFNHFADKREVLFGLSSKFADDVVREVAGTPNDVPPLDAVVCALQTVSDRMFEGHRAAVTRRQEIIDANPDLQERELAKRAGLTGAVAAALRARGLHADAALLTAGAGMLVQEAATRRWTEPGESRPLRELLPEALHSLRSTVR